MWPGVGKFEKERVCAAEDGAGGRGTAFSQHTLCLILHQHRRHKQQQQQQQQQSKQRQKQQNTARMECKRTAPLNRGL
jgi:hypothetical protein